MKFLLVLLLLVLGVVGYLLFGPSGGTGQPAEKTTVSQPATNADGTAPATASTDQPKQRMPVGTSFVDDAAAVGGYAMGHTQVMIKNRVSTKLKDTNKKHNEKLNDLMN